MRAYFDANATVPVLPQVLEAMGRAHQEAWGNPTSTHREGQAARRLLESSRAALAAGLGVKPSELVACGTATEALFLALEGLRPALGHRPVAVFPGEHSACLNPLKTWERVSWLPEVPGDCALVVQMAASNETGVLHPMPQVPGALRLKDAVQAWGKVPLDLSDCDIAVLSGHKMGGPRGAALLWLRPGLPWESPLPGPQERRRRGGTENTAALAGLAAAAAEVPARLAAHARLAPLRDALETEVCAWNLDVDVIGRDQPRLPNTSCLLLHGRDGEHVQMALDLAGFAVSTGSACHSGATEPSHAILSLGHSPEEARSVIRISLLPVACEAEVAAFTKALRTILQTPV